MIQLGTVTLGGSQKTCFEGLISDKKPFFWLDMSSDSSLLGVISCGRTTFNTTNSLPEAVEFTPDKLLTSYLWCKDYIKHKYLIQRTKNPYVYIFH